jgi:histidinol dehydrogenase
MLVVIAERNEGNAIVDAVERELSCQMDRLDRHEYLLPSLSHSRAFICARRDRAVEVVNRYAPEHLIISTSDPDAIERAVVNAGSIFLGPWSPESAGDYASGTNHTLPTGGWAHSTSGVSVDSFVKKITVQRLSADGLRSLGPTVRTLALAESLAAHAQAISVRLSAMDGQPETTEEDDE